jgi:hypothetical protein
MSPDPEQKLRRERITRTLAQPDTYRPGLETAMALWGQICDHLMPILGSRGVDALLSRALVLTGGSFPWLCENPKKSPVPGPFVTLRASLSTRPDEEASEANLALVITFTELLASLIGNSLTNRLLDPVWATGAAAIQQEDVI